MIMIRPYLEILEELTSPLFTTEWGRRLSIGVLAASGVILIALIVNSGFEWVKIFHSPVKLAETMGSERSVIEQISQIPEQHLFGKFGVVEKSGILPITSLQIQLTGIIKTKPDDLSKVIISEGGRPGRIYQAGDTLESGVRIDAITEEGVVLENGGQLEKLPLRPLRPKNSVKSVHYPNKIEAKPKTPVGMTDE